MTTRKRIAVSLVLLLCLGMLLTWTGLRFLRSDAGRLDSYSLGLNSLLGVIIAAYVVFFFFTVSKFRHANFVWGIGALAGCLVISNYINYLAGVDRSGPHAPRLLVGLAMLCWALALLAIAKLPLDAIFPGNSKRKLIVHGDRVAYSLALAALVFTAIRLASPSASQVLFPHVIVRMMQLLSMIACVVLFHRMVLRTLGGLLPKLPSVD